MGREMSKSLGSHCHSEEEQAARGGEGQLPRGCHRPASRRWKDRGSRAGARAGGRAGSSPCGAHPSPGAVAGLRPWWAVWPWQGGMPRGTAPEMLWRTPCELSSDFEWELVPMSLWKQNWYASRPDCARRPVLQLFAPCAGQLLDKGVIAHESPDALVPRKLLQGWFHCWVNLMAALSLKAKQMYHSMYFHFISPIKHTWNVLLLTQTAGNFANCLHWFQFSPGYVCEMNETSC